MPQAFCLWMPVCGARSPAPVCSPNAFYRPTPLRIRTQRSFTTIMRDRLEPQYPEVLACRDALAAAGSSTIRCSPTHGSLPARTASCSLRRSGNYPSPPF